MTRLLQRFTVLAAILPIVLAVALLSNVRFASTAWSGGHDGEVEDCGEELRANAERRQTRREIVPAPAARQQVAQQLRRIVTDSQVGPVTSVYPDFSRFSVRRLR